MPIGFSERHLPTSPPEDTQTCIYCEAPVLDTDVPPGYEPVCFHCQQRIEEESCYPQK